MSFENVVFCWQQDGFKLELFEMLGIDGFGRVKVPYRFYDGDTLIFEGSDFSPSPMIAYDTEESAFALMGFLSLMDGDTDDEYFKYYTEKQLAWRDSDRCEELSILVVDFENQEEES